MKRIYSLLFAIFFIAAAHAQTTVKPDEVLQVKEMEYDFGKIPQGKPVYHFFEVVNKSNKAIKLDNVQASCGCTTPEWSHDEIAPGATAKIKVGYNAASEGSFAKYITVQSAGTTQQIKISGQVWKAPTTSAPANASIQFLKQQVQ